MKNQLTVLPVEVAEIAKNVSAEKRNEVQSVLNHVFNGVSKMREQLDAVVVADENDKVSMKLAKTYRLVVKNIRLENEKIFDAKRTEVQQQMLSYKTEDSLWLKAKQTMQILTKEIEENAKWKEDTALRFEAERFELEMQQRLNRINKFKPELTINDVRQFNNENFELFLSGIEKAYNDKIEAEKKAEDERIAKEKAEAERIRLQEIENAKLKAEAEQREKEIAEERKKAEAEKLKLEQEANAKLKAEQEAKAKIENELRLKKEAEAKAESERLIEIERQKKEADKLAKAPIKKQLSIWVDGFSIAEINIDNDKKILIKEKFESFKKWAKQEIENL